MSTDTSPEDSQRVTKIDLGPLVVPAYSDLDYSAPMVPGTNTPVGTFTISQTTPPDETTSTLTLTVLATRADTPLWETRRKALRTAVSGHPDVALSVIEDPHDDEPNEESDGDGTAVTARHRSVRVDIATPAQTTSVRTYGFDHPGTLLVASLQATPATLDNLDADGLPAGPFGVVLRQITTRRGTAPAFPGDLLPVVLSDDQLTAGGFSTATGTAPRYTDLPMPELTDELLAAEVMVTND